MEKLGDRSAKKHARRDNHNSRSPAFGRSRPDEEEVKHYPSKSSGQKTPKKFPTGPEGPVDEAIQLIEINDEGEWNINERALNIIKGVNTKLGVISVVGPYRTGKSFLLNRLLGQQDGFEIGPTVQSCTRGIWIWGRPVKVAEDMHVILMDTEGLGSCNRTHNIDIKIFTLSVLLASMFVYNCLNAIDENAIEVLSLVVNLTKYISAQQKKDESGVYNQANYSPYFMWVIRDFSLKMVMTENEEDNPTYFNSLENQESAAKDYLEKSLEAIDMKKVHEENKKNIEKKNEIRKAIKNFFHQREAAILYRPVNEEEKLRVVNKIPYEDLRSEFRRQVEYLIDKIYRNVRPKSINGQTLSGPMFAQMITEYVYCMNNNGMPEINTAWDRVMETEIKRVLQQSLMKVSQELRDYIENGLPMTPKELLIIERNVRKKSFKMLHDPNIKNAPKDKLLKLEEDFMDGLDEIFESLWKQNETQSRSKAKDLLPRMYQKIKVKIKEDGYSNIQEFNDDFTKMVVSYLSNTKEPDNYVILENFITTNVLDDIDYIMKLQTDKMEMANIEMQQRIISDESLIEELKKEIERQKQKNKEKEEELRQKNKSIRADLENEMLSMQSQLRNKEDQFKDLELMLKKGWENNEKTIKEIKSKELENIQLKMSLENEKKLSKIKREYEEILSNNKKETKKVFEVTMSKLKSSYEDEIRILK